jgi:hypothetical protein
MSIESSVNIRPLMASDREAWEAMFHGYINFYEAKVPDDVIELTWKRLIEQKDGFWGIVALDDHDHPIGFAHVVFHPSTWSPTTYCYLEDLFVETRCAPPRRRPGADQGRVRGSRQARGESHVLGDEAGQQSRTARLRPRRDAEPLRSVSALNFTLIVRSRHARARLSRASRLPLQARRRVFRLAGMCN